MFSWQCCSTTFVELYISGAVKKLYKPTQRIPSRTSTLVASRGGPSVPNNSKHRPHVSIVAADCRPNAPFIFKWSTVWTACKRETAAIEVVTAPQYRWTAMDLRCIDVARGSAGVQVPPSELEYRGFCLLYELKILLLQAFYIKMH